MKTLIGISSLSLCLAAFPLFAEEANDCTTVRDDTWKQVSKDPTKVLEVVADMTAKMPPCSCSIVKAAIQSSKADAKLAASIVETAIKQAPEQMYVISQCAKAVAPEAAAEISEVVAHIDPNGVQNPLDIPGTPGLTPPAPNPPTSIPTITPPPATEVDFTN